MRGAEPLATDSLPSICYQSKHSSRQAQKKSYSLAGCCFERVHGHGEDVEGSQANQERTTASPELLNRGFVFLKLYEE